MAKMFYTLDEAADRLGLSEDQVKNMASEGKLQQFRDRDKLMFKVEQVDAMAANSASFTDEEDDRSTGLLSMADSDTDEISLDDSATKGAKKKDPRQETGVSIFDADEVEPADPMAQTQVTETIDDEEELALQSIGSGSGLLDLTRESDDTSLGAELLDEIYPGQAGEADASDVKMESQAGPSGLHSEDGDSGNDSNVNVAPGMSAQNTGAVSRMGTAPSTAAIPALVESPIAGQIGPGGYAPMPEAYDPAGSGLATGVLFVAAASLILCLIVGLALVQGSPDQVTAWLAKDNNLGMTSGGLAAGILVFGLGGFLIGKKQA